VGTVRLHRRYRRGVVTPTSDGSAIARMLEESRRGLDRVRPEDLAAEVRDGALVVDTRPVEQRERDGALPGALVIDRNVLEWRLDPSSPSRIEEVGDTHRRVVIVCNEGYSSSLAARTLRDLGLHRATDLVGGFQAWLAVSSTPARPGGPLPSAPDPTREDVVVRPAEHAGTEEAIESP
jgi:rhodanese-related sulfurtransferase